MLYQNNNNSYTLKTNDNLQTIRPFPDPSFPFIITHLNMAQLSIPYIPWHWHDEFEFVWVKSGSLTVGTSDGSFTLQPDDCAFLNSGILHMLKTQCDEDCDFFSVRFYGKLLFSDNTSSIATQYMHPLLVSPELRYIHLSAENPLKSRMIQLMKQIIQIYYMNQHGSELMILSKLYALWSELNEYLQQYPSASPVSGLTISDHDRVTAAIHYIAEHYADPLTLDDIANTIHVSKSECCRCFKRVVSLSPIEFLIQYRVMEAIRKMQAKEAVAKSISQLSASVGFNNTSYFNKQFKRHTNCTPLEYRKKLLSESQNAKLDKDFSDFFTNPTNMN
ncbi:MAG: helix-turn-helix domain-containing protein [Lachnospiraceae bacterium]|nr:helix-turn-helix domain-containing protein [Lachnospiraceae bacterium]